MVLATSRRHEWHRLEILRVIWCSAPSELSRGTFSLTFCDFEDFHVFLLNVLSRLQKVPGNVDFTMVFEGRFHKLLIFTIESAWR